MTETRTGTDKGVGMAIAFGVLALVGALATAGTSYAYALESAHAMQVYSGVALAVTMLFGGLSIAVLHAYGE